ncbi:hypothetical protein ABT180_00005, partial [Streptomyces sp. NPDC001657]
VLVRPPPVFRLHTPPQVVVVRGPRGPFDVRLSTGWCLMQSRLVTMGIAAEPDGTGTRLAVCGAARPAALGPVQRVYRGLLGKRRTRAFFRAVEHRAALR